MTGVMGGSGVPSWRRGVSSRHPGGVNRKTLAFIALVITILYGAGFAVVPDDGRSVYASLGAALVAIAWIAVGMLGRDEDASRDS